MKRMQYITVIFKMADRGVLSRETHLITSSLHFIWDRLQAVPFWIVERSCEIAERENTGENERRGAWGEAGKRGKSLLVYFTSLQSPCAVSAPSQLTRKGLLAGLYPRPKVVSIRQ